MKIVVEELSTRMAALGYDVTCFNRKGYHVAGKKYDWAAAADTYKVVKLRPVATIDHKGFAAVTSSFVAALKAAFGQGPCAMLCCRSCSANAASQPFMDWIGSVTNGKLGSTAFISS